MYSDHGGQYLENCSSIFLELCNNYDKSIIKVQ